MSEAIHHNSSHFAPISDANLTPVQAQVVAALAQGQTVTAAAEDAGIHRTTIHHWLRTTPAFKAAVENAQAEYAADLDDGLLELTARALHTLHDLLQDPTTPPAIRLKAALAVLQRPHAPNPAWHSPILVASRQAPQPVADVMEAVIETIPTPVARCSPCPCGSGRKYKRCCALSAHPRAA